MSLGKFIRRCALLATGWEASAQQYPIIPVPGAPKNVKTLFEDSQGRFWLGGDQLACFDGSRLFLMSDYGFPAGPTYSIDEDASGAVWIGAQTGVYRFWKAHFELQKWLMACQCCFPRFRPGTARFGWAEPKACIVL